ncbi:HPr family phosphocarrier protein [Nonomuraea sp. 10N515B]|uniref:HPr family phosphocarrier protein n=1 Tax=Nonomuraea sp. 10N515B TaxID=3457422 RepID=UPI003FCD7FDE
MTIAARAGLHARPAALLVQAAARQPGAVRIGRPGQRQVDAKSILSVLSLAIACGEEVLVETDGPSADEALTELLAMLKVDPDGH